MKRLDKTMAFTLLMLLNMTGFAATQAFLAVSLSMPSDALKEYIVEAHRLDIPIVIRGMYSNPDNHLSDPQNIMGNMNDTQLRIKFLMGNSKEGGIEIDPMLFRAFAIQVVPSLVVFDDAACSALDGASCAESSFDRVSGNTTLSTQLSIIAKKSSSPSRVKFCQQKLLIQNFSSHSPS